MPKKKRIAKKQARKQSGTTRGEVTRRREYLEAEKYARSLEASGSARAGQARAAADRALKALQRQIRERSQRQKKGKALRPRRKSR